MVKLDSINARILRKLGTDGRISNTDLAAYKVFHTDVLGTLPQVHSISSYVVMGSPKDMRA